MREEYNFTNARRNPYVKKEKQQITINLDSEVIAYFKVRFRWLAILFLYGLPMVTIHSGFGISP